ncbi:hypothetical protein HGRIS_009996 [Hohenbuehelia grisea]|uniref:NACHT domain-containing protein n=1 Tax=Hohenbuehelia grisea TaxID=104357 RepID=A0ABR3J3B1_9AGAR
MPLNEASSSSNPHFDADTRRNHNGVVKLIPARQASLSKLPIAKAARWNNSDSEACVEGSRISVLNTIKDWIECDTGPEILWLKGSAGKGKTTITATVARQADESRVLVASFFCSRNDEERSSPAHIIPTIAEQLSQRYPEYAQRFYDAIDSNPGIGYRPRSEQLRRLLLEPFQEPLNSPSSTSLLIIDAVDELSESQSQPSPLLIALLSEISSFPHLKILISSRPEYRVRSKLEAQAAQGRVSLLDLDDVPSSEVDHDIRLYLRHYLESTLGFTPEQIGDCDDDLQQLVQRSAQLFIFAATAIKTIHCDYDLHQQFNDIIAYDGIDQLYDSILTSSMSNLSPAERIKRARLISTVILLHRPLPPLALAQLSSFTVVQVFIYLEPFRSVLVIPREHAAEDGTVRIIHSSFRDFLTDTSRCTLSIFRDELDKSNILISSQLFRTMESLSLLDLDEDRTLSTTIDDPLAGQPLLEYACYFWSDHLALASPSDAEAYSRLIELFYPFVRSRRDHWLACLFRRDEPVIPAKICFELKEWYNSFSQTTNPSIILHLQEMTALTHSKRGSALNCVPDLDAAILACKSCLSTTLELSDSRRAELISRLIITYSVRDYLSGAQTHLEESMQLLEKGLALDIGPYQRSLLLGDMGIALFSEFIHISHDEAELDKSISLYRQSLSLNPRHTNIRVRINMVTVLRQRYSLQHNPVDIDEADELTLTARLLTNKEASLYQRITLIIARASVLVMQYARHRDVQILHEAISLAREAFKRSLPTFGTLGYASITLISTLFNALGLSTNSPRERMTLLAEIVETADLSLAFHGLNQRDRQGLTDTRERAISLRQLFASVVTDADSVSVTLSKSDSETDVVAPATNAREPSAALAPQRIDAQLVVSTRTGERPASPEDLEISICAPIDLPHGEDEENCTEVQTTPPGSDNATMIGDQLNATLSGSTNLSNTAHEESQGQLDEKQHAFKLSDEVANGKVEASEVVHDGCCGCRFM